MIDPHVRCFSETKVRGLVLRNRLIKAATFEGMTPNGVPGEPLTRLHRRLGQGGIALTNIGYCAAESNGRIDDNMMYMHEGVRAPLERLIREVKATGAAVMGQLGHAGTFTKNPLFAGKRPLGPSRSFSPIGLTVNRAVSTAMSTTQIRERVQVFAEAARFMKSVGFDAIEIHFGHGYGISQFISPKTNKRTDAYGGSLHNRMRFALEVLAAVRAAVGEDFPLFGKISMTDGVPGGVTYEDSLEIATLLERGGIDVIICSGGTSSFNPMLLFRGKNIRDGIMRQQKSAFMRLGEGSTRVFEGVGPSRCKGWNADKSRCVGDVPGKYPYRNFGIQKDVVFIIYPGSAKADIAPGNAIAAICAFAKEKLGLTGSSNCP